MIKSIQIFAHDTVHVSSDISKENLRAHVDFLCSDALEGRLTGSAGERLATEYIAHQFSLLNLKPAGDNGTYFQTFNYTAGVSLGEKNFFSITHHRGIIKHLILNKEWRPLSFSNSQVFQSGMLVFAGFGITEPATDNFSSYDSYHGINVKNKWVVVLEGMPEHISNERKQKMKPYSSLRYKAFTAKTRGAKGIIFISGYHPKTKDKLLPFSLNAVTSDANIIILTVKNKMIDELLHHTTHPLNSVKKIQYALNSGQLPSLPTLSHIKMMGQIDIKKRVQLGRNVLARLHVSQHAKELIVVGAHVDHLGHGEMGGSRAQDTEVYMIHPGADDNASGVSCVLEVAKKLSELNAQNKLLGNKDILFAAWSGEEFGILGSSHFVTDFLKKKPHYPLKPGISSAINLDMVGHLREKLVLQGIGSSTDWTRILNTVKIKQPLSIVMQADPYLPTDSTSFYLHQVPAVNFFTGAHDAYHSPRDRPETLNYEGMQSISEFLVVFLTKLEKEEKAIHYTEVEKASRDAKLILRVYLGTIPDYASSDITGVKISGVAKNSPAKHAGLKPNDIIIKLAEKDIHDIYDYTFTLNELPVGKSSQIVVIRGKTKIFLTITPQYRNVDG